MIKNNKKQVILSSISILLPILIGIVMWNALPDRIATHWGVDGTVDGWSSKAFAVFGLPLILLGLHWICIAGTMLDPKNKEQSSKVFGMIMWLIPLISLSMNGATYAVALGYADSMIFAVRILVGGIFIIVGNYLPKCKQNHTIGIRIPWTLKNKENWNKTHRFAGKVWVLGGVFLLLTLFLPMAAFVYICLGVTIVMVAITILYSYHYDKKQRA